LVVILTMINCFARRPNIKIQKMGANVNDYA